MTVTEDGDCILVVDSVTNRVGKFCAATGTFITNMASEQAHGISSPREALQYDDTTLVVARRSVTCIGADGAVVNNLVLRSKSGLVVQPESICSSALWGGVVVKGFDGSVFLFRNTWARGSRGAWLCAICME